MDIYILGLLGQQQCCVNYLLSVEDNNALCCTQCRWQYQLDAVGFLQSKTQNREGPE